MLREKRGPGRHAVSAIAIDLSDLVVLAGQVGNDPAAQFRNAMANVRTALKAQGGGPAP